MSPVVRISDLTFGRLQKHAVPFVDTPETVISKILEFYESHGHQQSSTPKDRLHVTGGVFDPDNHPDLHHTRIIAAEFDGRQASGWNELVRVAHARAMEHFRTFEALRSASLSNISSGQRNVEGFHYAPEIDISIQYADANMAWRNALHLARKLSCAIHAEFEWRNKKGAALPGQSGVLSWKMDHNDSGG
jgi:hypothetical protein